MTVAEMIKKTRTEANMTQGEYGAKFGVSRQTVSSWENGRSLPDLQMLIDICNTYHVSLDKLLNEDKEFVEKIDFYNKYKKAIRLVGMCLLAGLLIFAIVFINWKITERNMNQAFEMNAEKLGFVKGEDIEISISIYDGEDFAIEFNHFRSIKGCFDKDSNIEIMENTLNEKENIFYTENNEMIEDVLKQLLEIHKNVYRR